MSTLESDLQSIDRPFERFELPEAKEVISYLEGRFEVICPVLEEPDNLWLEVELVPNSSGDFIEYVSFHKWLTSIRDEPLGIEGSCNLIYNHIKKICSPTKLKVTVQTGYKTINQKVVKKSWKDDLHKH
tara:strand:+ start:72864 stop:73250 length:387 start_codon:yes stop_codon:yes gene_type:complete